MYIMFKGKGCENCPFMTISSSYAFDGDILCNLSEIEDCDGTRLPKIEASWGEKPKECPFSDGLQQVEIGAETNE